MEKKFAEILEVMIYTGNTEWYLEAISIMLLYNLFPLAALRLLNRYEIKNRVLYIKSD